MPAKAKEQAIDTSAEQARDIRQELARMYGAIDVEEGTKEKVTAIHKGKNIVVHIPPTLLTSAQRDTCMVQAISAIETLQCEASFRQDNTYADAVATYDQYRTN